MASRRACHAKEKRHVRGENALSVGRDTPFNPGGHTGGATLKENVFCPDIFVRESDCPAVLRLIVKIETETAHLDETARKLRQYMIGGACSLALLVTPEETHVYLETYSDAPNSIQEFAVVKTPVLIKTRGIIHDGPELERAVMRWLDTMAQHPGIPLHLTGEAARVEEYLLPAMLDVDVRVSGPR